jgi:hypothetical protein
MGRSRERVLAAFRHARTLFPFPILGLDTDCGGEFINEEMGAYCEREQILLTRGRPYLKNDQAYVEQKNGTIVRQVIGYDRYDGEYTCQQIAELYQAWQLYVNCFQPSMKLVISDETEVLIARHDPAKTPLQRVLLSGILAAEKEQEWLALARAIDPVRLLKQVEQLQRAVFRCAVGATPFPHRQPATPVLRFHEHLCQTESFSRSQERPVERDPTPLEPPENIDPLAWPRTRRDPFQGEWEYILFCIQAMPELTGGALLRHLQRRTPERYHPGHLRSLQRGLRHLRTALPIVRKHSPSAMVAWEVVPPPRSSAPSGPKEGKTFVSHTMPDSDLTAPKADLPPIRVVEPEVFARLLAGCRPPEQMGPGEETATLRNQALLWLFWEGGISVSEACALRVGAVSLRQGMVRLSGPGTRERRIVLGQESQRALGLYLARLS